MTHSKLVLGAALALATAACSRPGSDDAFQWSAAVPAGAVVHIRDGAGDIVVRRAQGQSANVVGSRTWRRGRAKDIRFVVNQAGNDYYVCAMWRNSGSCGDSGYRGRNVGGFLAMFSLFHRTTDAAVRITVDIPANVVVDARTSNGSVQIDGTTAGVSARTINGTIRASNVSGPLSLATTNGDVRLSTNSVTASDSIRLTTTNGSVHADLPANMEGAFDLSVVNGRVQSDFPLQPASESRRADRHLQGQIGVSTRSVRMRSVNGQVVVTRTATPATF